MTPQSGIPRRPILPRGAMSPPMLSGVVVATYYADDEAAQVPTSRQRQVLCDVLYARGGGSARVPVVQRGYSITNGSLWVPQPATRTLSGEPLRLVRGDAGEPATALDDMDADWVVVAFLDSNFAHPTILGALPHPRGRRPQAGKEHKPLPSYEAGVAEMLPPDPDGLERWLAHQGTVARIDRGGNLRIDLAGAGVANDGDTPAAPGETVGWTDVNLGIGARLIVRSAGMPVFVLTAETDGQVTLDIGQIPSERAVLGERMLALFDAHRHPTPLGLTGAVALEDRMATAQEDPARAVLSERVRLPATDGGEA